MRWSVIIAAAVVLLSAGIASAQTPVQPAPRPAGPSQAGPTVVDADTISYDSAQQIVSARGNVRVTLPRYRLFADRAEYNLRTQVLIASGRLRLVDSRGQELRGQELTFNTRTEEGFLTPVEGTFERRVFIRGERGDTFPNRYVVQNSTVTSCDPAKPLYRIEAKHIEIRVGDEVVARDATLYLGARKIITLREYVISLRPGEEGTRIPTVGVTHADGLWAEYKLPIRFEGGAGRFTIKVGAKTGPMPLLSLTTNQKGFDVSLRLGRTQTSDVRTIDPKTSELLRYDVAEIAVTTGPTRIGATPFTLTVSALAGWYAEQISGTQTAKFDGSVVVGTSRPITPKLSYSVTVGLQVSGYATGAVRTNLNYGASLAYVLDQFTTVSLGYARVIIQGATPLLIDVIDPADTVSLVVSRAVPFRYRWSLGAAYNRAVPETKISGGLFAIVSRRLELGVEAVYNTRLVSFEDLDYTVRVICDCIDFVVRYRQARAQLSFEIGLMDLPPRLAPFVPRPAPPLPAPPER